MEKVYYAQASTIGYVGSNVPRIYATLDGRQANHQCRMIKVVGKIDSEPISIFIDYGVIHSYTAPNLVEKCHLKKIKLETERLV